MTTPKPSLQIVGQRDSGVSIDSYGTSTYAKEAKKHVWHLHDDSQDHQSLYTPDAYWFGGFRCSAVRLNLSSQSWTNSLTILLLLFTRDAQLKTLTDILKPKNSLLKRDTFLTGFSLVKRATPKIVCEYYSGFDVPAV